MPTRQEIRSEETKRAIVTAAAALFTERGYDAVTMREIAKAAGCSHTTIYIYFKDKEALLHQLSMGPLHALREEMEMVLSDQSQSPDVRLKQMTRVFLRFCLANRTMYTILFMAKGSRVDEGDPALEIQRLRNHLFALLTRAVGECLPPGSDDGRVLAYARIYFFTLHGILSTYTAGSEESTERLLERLESTFELAVEVLLAGFIATARTGG